MSARTQYMHLDKLNYIKRANHWQRERHEIQRQVYIRQMKQRQLKQIT
jgi:hypothetical protein